MRYLFTQWENGSPNPVRTLTIDQNLTIMANYKLATKRITFDSQPVKVQAVIAGQTVNAEQSIDLPEGSVVTVTVPRRG